jgi:SHAQKYF class myb-like DNA-binding protein
MSEFIDDDLPLPSFEEVFSSNPALEKDETRSKKRKYKSQSSNDKQDKIGESAAGRWTTEEHELFLQGVLLYGRQWRKMQPLIKTRSIVQIRTHAQKVFKKDVGNIRSKLLASSHSSSPREAVNDEGDEAELVKLIQYNKFSSFDSSYKIANSGRGSRHR